ncbi:MAG: hypothetical protein ACE5FI_16815, partial [Anaerolineales bacterium]
RTPLTVPSLIVVYEPLALALGIGGAVLAARGDRLVRRMLVSVVVGLAFGIVYSGRDSWDALWVAIPLAIAAAHVVVRTFAGSWDKGEFEVTVGQTAILLLLIVFAGLNLATFANAYETSPGDITYLSLGLALGVAALYVLSATLFASGWTTRCALRAVVASVVLAGLAVTVRAGWGVAFANAGRANELWRVEVTSPNARLMVASVEAISLRHVGDVHDVGITVQGDRNGALGWYLREFTHVVWVDSLGPAVNTPVIITPEFVTNPALGSSYLGESFAFVSRWDGRRQHPAAFVGYALFRAAPGENEHIVVWVREDVQLLRE